MDHSHGHRRLLRKQYFRYPHRKFLRGIDTRRPRQPSSRWTAPSCGCVRHLLAPPCPDPSPAPAQLPSTQYVQAMRRPGTHAVMMPRDFPPLAAAVGLSVRCCHGRGSLVVQQGLSKLPGRPVKRTRYVSPADRPGDAVPVGQCVVDQLWPDRVGYQQQCRGHLKCLRR